MRGDRQRRHTVHEAGREASEAPIAERRIRLQATQHRKIDAEHREGRLHRLYDAQIGHRIEQHAADQKFEREIIDALAIRVVSLARRIHPAVDDDVARGEGDGQKPVALAGGHDILADRIDQLGQNRVFERFGGGRRRVVGTLGGVWAELVHFLAFFGAPRGEQSWFL